jgi:hypothetical protein
LSNTINETIIQLWNYDALETFIYDQSSWSIAHLHTHLIVDWVTVLDEFIVEGNIADIFRSFEILCDEIENNNEFLWNNLMSFIEEIDDPLVFLSFQLNSTQLNSTQDMLAL